MILIIILLRIKRRKSNVKRLKKIEIYGHILSLFKAKDELLELSETEIHISCSPYCVSKGELLFFG